MTILTEIAKSVKLFTAVFTFALPNKASGAGFVIML